MLKIRVIPILTYNGFALVKTKEFKNPRMLGNPVQAARVYNSRGVDELVFVDIFASKQGRKINLKIAKEVIKECFMPVAIGGGIDSLEDINNLLQIGADKVIIKKIALLQPDFIKTASNFYGSQCISIAVDVVKVDQKYKIFNEFGLDINLSDFVLKIQDYGAGEILLNSVDNDGMMSGFDHNLFNLVFEIAKIPIVFIGGGGDLNHYIELFSETNCQAVGTSSLFNFTQFTPLDIKNELKNIGKPVRL
jgi:cyclase